MNPIIFGTLIALGVMAVLALVLYWIRDTEIGEVIIELILEVFEAIFDR